MGTAQGAELSQFIAFVACLGQSKMAALGYSPIPPNLVEDDFQAAGRLPGAPTPPPPTPQNCPNPYITGSAHVTGRPARRGWGQPRLGPRHRRGAATAASSTSGATAGSQVSAASGPGVSGPGSSASSTAGGKKVVVKKAAVNPLTDPAQAYPRQDALDGRRYTRALRACHSLRLRCGVSSSCWSSSLCPSGCGTGNGGDARPRPPTRGRPRPGRHETRTRQVRRTPTSPRRFRPVIRLAAVFALAVLGLLASSPGHSGVARAAFGTARRRVPPKRRTVSTCRSRAPRRAASALVRSRTSGRTRPSTSTFPVSVSVTTSAWPCARWRKGTRCRRIPLAPRASRRRRTASCRAAERAPTRQVLWNGSTARRPPPAPSSPSARSTTRTPPTRPRSPPRRPSSSARV